MLENVHPTTEIIWSVTDLFCDDIKRGQAQQQCDRIILPFTLLRRLECVLENKKDSILAKYTEIKTMPLEVQDLMLKHAAQLPFYNTSKLDLGNVSEAGLVKALKTYLNAYSPNVREIIEHFDIFNTLDELFKDNLLNQVIQRFAKLDLHPDTIDNHHMGEVFDELIRRVSEHKNLSEGEIFTPRDIVRLTTSLTLTCDEDVLTQPGIVRSIYDPAAGNGGFLLSAMECIHEKNEKAELIAFGQEISKQSYTLCKALILATGHEVDNIKLGNTLADDQLKHRNFSYMFSAPPFGLRIWHNEFAQCNDPESDLPRISNGSLCFLMKLLSKMHSPSEGGSRIGFILNDSSLFAGNAGSGESEVRRFILEHDLLDAVIALPTNIFYNTNIATHILILTNVKAEKRKGKVQLINACNNNTQQVNNNFFSTMPKPLGTKRKYISQKSIDAMVRLYCQCKVDTKGEQQVSNILDYQDFGYRRITIQQPLQLSFDITQEKLDRYYLQSLKTARKKKPDLEALPELPNAYLELSKYIDSKPIMSRDKFLAIVEPAKLSKANKNALVKLFGEHDEAAEVCYAASGRAAQKGKMEPNSKLRSYKNVPLKENIYEYFEREVKPYAALAWIDESVCDKKDGQVGIVGYEIRFNHHVERVLPD